MTGILEFLRQLGLADLPDGGDNAVHVDGGVQLPNHVARPVTTS